MNHAMCMNDTENTSNSTKMMSLSSSAVMPMRSNINITSKTCTSSTVDIWRMLQEQATLEYETEKIRDTLDVDPLGAFVAPPEEEDDEEEEER
jgi:hypothetical protein